jgi:hypothetical protein
VFDGVFVGVREFEKKDGNRIGIDGSAVLGSSVGSFGIVGNSVTGSCVGILGNSVFGISVYGIDGNDGIVGNVGISVGNMISDGSSRVGIGGNEGISTTGRVGSAVLGIAVEGISIVGMVA